VVRILFVCLGNICRSPTADGVFRKLVAEAGLSHRFESDSAGVSDYHQGEPPDERAGEGAKIGLFLDHAPHLPVREVPDPYLGGEEHFEEVLDLIEEGAKGLLAHLQREPWM